MILSQKIGMQDLRRANEYNRHRDKQIPPLEFDKKGYDSFTAKFISFINAENKLALHKIMR